MFQVPGECEGKDQFATFAMVMLAAVSVLQFLFAITVTVAAIFVLSKVSFLYISSKLSPSLVFSQVSIICLIFFETSADKKRR